MRRFTLILAATIGTTLAFPLVALADQAILAEDAKFIVGPGHEAYGDGVLVMSRAGMPTVTFDNGATGFADEETVIATITLSTQDADGFGSVEMLSSPTITGTTSADWTIEGSSQFEFQPAIEYRYTAPSPAELGCADHPGKRFTTHLGVSATMVGSAGTTASFSAEDFPPVVTFVVTCPASAARTDAPAVTAPPTDTLPRTGTPATRPEWLLFLAVATGAGLVLTRRSSRGRPHP